MNSDYGYNINEGGSFPINVDGEHNPFYGKKHSEKSLKIMREKNMEEIILWLKQLDV